MSCSRTCRFFDGLELLRDRDVLVTGLAITDVGPTGTTDAPPQALVLDGVGRTLMPGLIDSHVHFISAGEKAGPATGTESHRRGVLVRRHYVGSGRGGDR